MLLQCSFIDQTLENRRGEEGKASSGFVSTMGLEIYLRLLTVSISSLEFW